MKQWDAEGEMRKRVERIRSGRDEAFSDYEVIQYNPVSINDASGYEIVLKKHGFLAHTYDMVSRDYIAISIAIVASGKDRQYIVDTLKDAIRKSLEVR